MDEENFPRQDIASSLYALPRTLPAKGDEDRYLFLELLVSAEDYFIMSYQRTDKVPSRLVDELMSYLKNTPLTLHHPMQVQTTRSHKERAFFSYAPIESDETPIDLRALRKLARHPLQFYFNERHGIYVKNEDEAVDAFCLSALEKHALKRISLKSSLVQAAEYGKKSGVLPDGLFREVALHTLAEEVQEQEQCLHTLGIQGSDLFSIELSLHCREAMRRHKGGWVVPAPIVRGVPIVGTLSDVSPQGLLVNAEQDLEGMLSAWPHYLIFLSVKDLCGVDSALLFAKDGKKYGWEGETPACLEAYVDYYFRALNSPSPLMPAWASRLLKGEKEAFCALVDKEPFYTDAYLEWMQNSGIHCGASEWYDRWMPYLQENFKWILTF
jgi:exonuclease V gamma subunit